MSLVKIHLEDNTNGEDVTLRVQGDLQDPKTFAEVLGLWLVRQALDKSAEWKLKQKEDGNGIETIEV